MNIMYRYVQLAVSSSNLLGSSSVKPVWLNALRVSFNLSGRLFRGNRALVDYASEPLCYWDGGGGGTKFTLGQARQNGLDIQNLF